MHSFRVVLLFLAIGVALGAVTSPPAYAYFSVTQIQGRFLPAAQAFYMSTSPVLYEISPVPGTSPQLYTLIQNGYYLSAELHGSGFNQDGANYTYNQWEFTQIDAIHYTIYSSYAQSTYGFPYLCAASSPLYGPYAPEMCQTTVTWTVQGYFGCYNDSTPRDLPTIVYDTPGSALATIETCQTRCGLDGYQYAGLQYAYQCWCGNSFGNYGGLPDSSCAMNCDGDSAEKCGDSWKNSVYSAFPSTYIGCFVDEASRDLPYMVWDSNTHLVTIEGCLISCGEEGYAYAGLQDGRQCFCGNSYGAFGQVPDGECGLPCVGDSRETCGNSWRNQIYRTSSLITSPPSYPHPTPAPTPAPTSAPTPAPTSPPTPAPPAGCAYWNGSTITSGTQLRIYSPTIDKWLNFGNLPIGTNPLGLWFQSTAATFTLNSVAAFSSGWKGAFTSPNGDVFDSSYSGNFVTVNIGGGNNWHIAAVPAGLPNVNLYAVQIGATYNMILGLQNMNSQTMLGYLQPNNNFHLFIC